MPCNGTEENFFFSNSACVKATNNSSFDTLTHIHIHTQNMQDWALSSVWALSSTWRLSMCVKEKEKKRRGGGCLFMRFYISGICCCCLVIVAWIELKVLQFGPVSAFIINVAMSLFEKVCSRSAFVASDRTHCELTDPEKASILVTCSRRPASAGQLPARWRTWMQLLLHCSLGK